MRAAVDVAIDLISARARDKVQRELAAKVREALRTALERTSRRAETEAQRIVRLKTDNNNTHTPAALRPAGNRGREGQTTKLWLDLQAAVFVHAPAVLPSHRTPEPATMNTALVDMSAVSGRVVQLAVAIRARGVHARLNWPEPIAH